MSNVLISNLHERIVRMSHCHSRCGIAKVQYKFVLSRFIVSLFTQMQDDSNLKMTSNIKHIFQMTSNIKHISQGKTYLSKSKTTPKNKMPAKKQYFIVNFMHLLHKKKSDSIYLFWSVLLSPSSQSVPSYSSQSLLTCPFSLIPFHNKSSSVPSTALLNCPHSHFW